MLADPTGGRMASVTPVEFLTARLDELDAVALAAQQQHPTFDVYGKTAHEEVCQLASGEGAWGAVITFVEMLTPEVVLADVAAKRAIIKLHERVPVDADREHPSGATGCRICDLDFDCDSIMDRGAGACDTLLALVQAFADHPDFDPAWRT